MDFSALNKQTAKGYQQQKSLIKKVLSGKPCRCADCGGSIKSESTEQGLKVTCERGCTDILLELG